MDKQQLSGMILAIAGGILAADIIEFVAKLVVYLIMR